MQPVARTRVHGASFVLLFATGRGVYLHAFVCHNILNTTALTFYNRVCSYLNIGVNPARGCICHVAPPYFSFVHGVHCRHRSVFHARRAWAWLLCHSPGLYHTWSLLFLCKIVLCIDFVVAFSLFPHFSCVGVWDDYVTAEQERKQQGWILTDKHVMRSSADCHVTCGGVWQFLQDLLTQLYDMNNSVAPMEAFYASIEA